AAPRCPHLSRRRPRSTGRPGISARPPPAASGRCTAPARPGSPSWSPATPPGPNSASSPPPSTRPDRPPFLAHRFNGCGVLPDLSGRTPRSLNSWSRGRAVINAGALLRYLSLGGRCDLARCPGGPDRLFRAGPPVVEGHLDVLLGAPLVLQCLQGHAGPVRLGQWRLDDGPRPEPAGHHHVDLGT